ncbi:MAG TPA: transposase [Thermodesulfobacteriota bacterium]|nr:transposase [Thermodesulfobacteriota bacterium]
MSLKNKHYDPEFRQKAIRLALTSSQPISTTAKDLGIKETTLYYWVKDSRKKEAASRGSEDSNAVDAYSEMARLRKENARLREEREILKKAAAFFAKESN